jgi:hypothetical protein
VAIVASPHGWWMRRAGDEDTREAVIALPGLEAALAAQFGPVGVSLDADGGVVREFAGLALVRNVTWATSNVFRHLPAERVPDFRGLLRLMTAGLRTTNLDVCVDACWALAYAAEQEGGVPRLLETVSCATDGAAGAGRMGAVTIPVCAVRADGAAGGVPGQSLGSAGQAGIAPVRGHRLGCVVMLPCVCLCPVTYNSGLLAQGVTRLQCSAC